MPQTYENVTGGTESSQYEMTKSEPSLPSEYTELGVSSFKIIKTEAFMQILCLFGYHCLNGGINFVHS